jgi:hypothetical protein
MRTGGSLSLLARMASDPTRPLPREYQFLHSSALVAAIAFLVGPDKRLLAGFFTALVLLACGSLLYLCQRSCQRDEERNAIITTIALSPLLHVLGTNIGQSDPILVIGYVGLIVGCGFAKKCAAALVMFAAHPQQAALLLLIHVLCFGLEFSHDRIALQQGGSSHLRRLSDFLANWESVLPIAVGVVLAVCAQGLYFRMLMWAPEGRLSYAIAHAGAFAADSARVFPAGFILISGFLAVPLGISLVSGERRFVVPYVLAYLVTYFVGDTGRVFCMVSLPIVLGLAIRTPRLLRSVEVDLGAYAKLSILGLFAYELVGARLMGSGWLAVLLR